MRKEVFILGSGASINDLTEEEKAHINQAPVRIALNKFTAFYKKAGILPSHVFFIDIHSPSSTNMLQYIFDLCHEDGLGDMVFIANKEVQNRVFQKKGLLYYVAKYHPISLHRHHAYYLIQRPFHIDFIDFYHYLEGGSWAKSRKEKLYHFRSSLTTVLNYVSILYPGWTIKLLGVDLNSKAYFFEEELKKLDFSASDWTTQHTKKENKHFTVQTFQGTNLLDKIPYVVEELAKTDNNIYCCSRESLLVQDELIEYQGII